MGRLQMLRADCQFFQLLRKCNGAPKHRLGRSPPFVLYCCDALSPKREMTQPGNDQYLATSGAVGPNLKFKPTLNTFLFSLISTGRITLTQAASEQLKLFV